MVRRGLGHDRCLTFSQVDLGGLEPLTSCLQNRPRLSDTVAHLGLSRWARPLGSGLVGCCCGQPWWSAPTSLPLVRSQAHRPSYRPYRWLSCWVCVGVRAWARRSSLSWPPSEARRGFAHLGCGVTNRGGGQRHRIFQGHRSGQLDLPGLAGAPAQRAWTRAMAQAKQGRELVPAPRCPGSGPPLSSRSRRRLPRA